jgi:penicillin-binding protein 2
MAIGFAACLALVFLRIVWLEFSEGREFRALAAKPLEKARPLPGVRGRILSHDRQVLAFDQRISSLAVHYRYLEDPSSARWLRSQARARIPRDEPRRAARLTAELAWVTDYRDGLIERLARLCGRPSEEVVAQGQNIQTRVRAIATAVNRSRLVAVQPNSITTTRDQEIWQTVLAQLPLWLFASDEPRDPAKIIVAEELDYHVLVADVPLEVVAEIESRPQDYPGVRIVEQSRRQYPAGSSAANILGHLGHPDDSRAHDQADGPSRLVGRLATEGEFEPLLRGRNGRLVDLTDHSGRLLSTYRQTEPASGLDVVLTLDARLQRIAEEHLDHALAKKMGENNGGSSGGGAIVVVDVASGAILAAATAPRFNPNLFAANNPDAVERLLHDPAHPLFDRVTKMAIPPGSVFKVVTALALLADENFDPEATFDCQGFLAQPDRQRCQIFRRYGLGHGPTSLSGALAQSCNVYFFHHAERLGPAPLHDWGTRLGLGVRTGIDLPGEVPGFVPDSDHPGVAKHTWSLADTQALSIGQSTLTATPLQMARLMAAIANGGLLVRPHILSCFDAETAERRGNISAATAQVEVRGTPIAGLGPRQLAILHSALARVVDDPQGTAYAALADSGIAVAGKTGTAETGDHSPDHAWFAGYAPAQAPRLAFAIALEHHGSSEQAAAIAKELVQAMQALDLLSDNARLDVAGRDRP